MESDSKVIDHSNTLLEIGGKVTEKRKKKTNWRGRGGYRGRGGSCSQGLINNNTDVNVLELSEGKLQQSSQKIQLGNENNVNEVAEANESSENVSNKIEERKKSQWRGWYRRGRGANRGRGRSNSEEFINNDNITFNSLDSSGNENILQCWSSQEIQSGNENKVNENAENVGNNFSGRQGRRGWRNGNRGRQRWGKIQSNECETDTNCQEVNSQQMKKWPNRGRGGFRGRGKSNISQTDNIQTEYNTPWKIDDEKDWAKGQWRDQVGENFRNGNRDKENENNFSSMIGKYMKRDTSYTKVSDILECEADHYCHENQNKISLPFENTKNTTDVLKNSVESQNVFNANEELCLPKSKRNRRRRKNHKKLNKTDSVNLGLPTENLKEKDTENEIKAQASCIKSTGTHHIPDISFNQWVSQNWVEIAKGGMPASHFPVAAQSSVTREVGSSQYHNGVEKKTRNSLQDLFSQASLLTNQSRTNDQASLLASKSLNSDDPLASFDTVSPAVSHKKQHMSSISSTTSFQDKSSIITPKNSSLNHLLFKSSSQPIPVKTSQTFQKAKYKLSPADSGPCNKLDFFLSPYCKLVVKSYGDIAKEKSELLVSVLGPEVDMRRTKVGQSFNREFPFHMEELHYCRKSNPNSKVLTIQNPIGSNCKAICHAILTPWDKDNSQGQIETALDNIFDVVHQLNIKSISIPPLGYGQAFKFPADYMVKWLLNYIVKLRIKNDFQKIIIVAPDPKLFYEFRQQGPSYFGFAVKVRLEHELIQIDDITCDVNSCQSPKRGTVDFMKYLAQQNNIFPSHWSLNELNEQPAVTTWGSSMINMFSNIFGVSKKTPVKAKQVDVDSETHAAIQKLIQETLDTSVIGHGADATNMYYSTIKVTSIKRIENPVLFEKYHNRRKELLEKMIKKGLVCKDIGKITGSKGKLLTKKLLSEAMEKELYSEINEHYLFHGTKEGAITSIIENGFDPSCSNTAAMFGQGIYAAEKFTKADQYTDDKFQRSPNGTNLKLILARMLLGNVFICDENHKLVVQKVGRKFKKPPCMSCSEDLCHCVNTDHFDSLMADGKWLFREFIVYESSQIYPEYIITYQRV
ncbi:hypothetical protein Btru_066214 [Bulinus truncatus]|nr:hypothetical protein Btru_066214 [Bulinus truncatus]